MRNQCGRSAMVASVALLFTLSGAARAQQDGYGGGAGGGPQPEGGGRGAGGGAPPQGGGRGAARKPAPPLTRTPDGQPDLQGVWNNVNGTGISYENLELQSIEQQ